MFIREISVFSVTVYSLTTAKSSVFHFMWINNLMIMILIILTIEIAEDKEKNFTNMKNHDYILVLQINMLELFYSYILELSRYS